MSDQAIDNIGEEFKEVATAMPNTPVATSHAIASIALSMAMKYHGINTVQDGTLYQQYKLEGKNMQPLHIDMVLETATRLEVWLVASSERIAGMVIDAIVQAPEEAEGPDDERGTGAEARSAEPVQNLPKENM